MAFARPSTKSIAPGEAGTDLHIQLSRPLSLDMVHYFIGRWQIRKSLADLAPALNAMPIHQQRGIKRNIMAGERMYQAVLANHLGSRITKHGKMTGEHLIPELAGLRTVVDTDGDELYAEPIELLIVPRELAQFSHAIGSPVTSIKDEQHRMPAQATELD